MKTKTFLLTVATMVAVLTGCNNEQEPTYLSGQHKAQAIAMMKGSYNGSVAKVGCNVKSVVYLNIFMHIAFRV